MVYAPALHCGWSKQHIFTTNVILKQTQKGRVTSRYLIVYFCRTLVLRMRTSLIITTYNRPKVLAMALRSIAEQSVLPDEVIVADDGSTRSTAAMVRKIARNFPVELIHVWQEDKGFRAARVRNLGASKASGDMLVFIDGDMVLHKDFMKFHLLHASRGHISPWAQSDAIAQTDQQDTCSRDNSPHRFFEQTCPNVS